jgi:hypothetical protein
MADEEKKDAARPRLKLEARDAESAPSLWPVSIAVDDSYKDRIREALAICAKKIRETRKLYQNYAKATVDHKVRGAVMLRSSDLLELYDRYKGGSRELGIEMGWYTAYNAQQDAELALVQWILQQDVGSEDTMIMVLFNDGVSISLDDCPYGVAYVR